ncbi:hypothetical protein [Fusobacterium polymorphum]|uniref:hypothetical protein n=1 Tax=Fusobacterium nucleatum subsp. polymorphum TaxID=76857 RepID=UPI002921B8B4|nr:hypothetical protein [Fusobacterium polymorphum]BEO90944.1 hypothetical protein FNCP4_01560 [Fusobacterium nucleatum]WRL74602.1 hypothetical protein VKN80_08250 [Fusobacterium polymorphum]BEO97933.1 hypothetical protein FNCP11_02490 [Fusobacterium nucleatum]BEP03017.1 hypothetical protein FNSP4_07510 [Fusobacterium nucleatum]BEP09325.1 hypothetical protein FNSP11_01690 [Fusobacterium nucleatum]
MKKGILIFILAVSASVFGKENLNNVKIVTSSNVVTSNFSTTDSSFEKDRKDIMDLYEKFLKNENNKEELAKITTKDFSLNKVNKTSPKKNEEILKKIEKIDTYSNLEESSSFNIENDKATLTVKKASTSKKEKVNNIEGKELKLEFKKVNNKWLIDKTEETIF